MDKFTELVGSEITARFLKPTQETQEVLQRVVHLLDEVLNINLPPEDYALNGRVFAHTVRGVKGEVIALLEKSKQPYVTQWVGLKDKDMNDRRTQNFDFIYGARWAEAKLKERNG